MGAASLSMSAEIAARLRRHRKRHEAVRLEAVRIAAVEDTGMDRLLAESVEKGKKIFPILCSKHHRPAI